MANTTIRGMAFIRIDGRMYESEGAFSITLGGKKKTPIISASGTVYVQEELIPGKISGTLLTTVGFDAQALKNANSVTVQVQAKNGSTYILRDALFTGDGEIDAKEGGFTVEFQGASVRVMP